MEEDAGALSVERIEARMITGRFMWKPLVQWLVTGQARRFTMASDTPSWPGQLTSPGLYLHVPFCRSLCPYCPYNRIAYDADLFAAYERAVKAEIDLYAPHLADQSFGSLYIGGGTPTVNWRGLVAIVQHLRERFADLGDICVELHPGNMDPDCLAGLKDVGVTMLSIGVESTSDDVLTRIRRSHDGRTALEAIERALMIGFRSVNVDLMFALPGQSLQQWERDVSTVLGLGVDQLSTYPMFSFPYSDLGRADGVRRVQRPPEKLVRAMLDLTHEHCEQHGLQRCAVWSWLKPGLGKFSSITRHHYIGFGPSAASMTGSDFYINTFDVRSYVDALPTRRPIAVSMPVRRRLEMAYWLYWRIYELRAPDADFRRVFGPDASLDGAFGHLLRPLIPLGLISRSNGEYRVTKSGAYWIHRLQNEYTLSYIDHVWGSCRDEPWPAEVAL
jgi:coproporphyrinogen III oxidase-like Fe-S oxidoreductase